MFNVKRIGVMPDVWLQSHGTFHTIKGQATHMPTYTHTLIKSLSKTSVYVLSSSLNWLKMHSLRLLTSCQNVCVCACVRACVRACATTNWLSSTFYSNYYLQVLITMLNSLTILAIVYVIINSRSVSRMSNYADSRYAAHLTSRFTQM